SNEQKESPDSAILARRLTLPEARDSSGKAARARSRGGNQATLAKRSRGANGTDRSWTPRKRTHKTRARFRRSKPGLHSKSEKKVNTCQQKPRYPLRRTA